MPIDNKVMMIPDNCIDLKERFDSNNSMQLNNYNDTVDLVRLYLFTRFSCRKDGALRFLRKSYHNKNLKVHSIKKDGATWAYISLNKAKDEFYFVAAYQNTSKLETAPSEREEEMWRKYNLPKQNL